MVSFLVAMAAVEKARSQVQRFLRPMGLRVLTTPFCRQEKNNYSIWIATQTVWGEKHETAAIMFSTWNTYRLTMKMTALLCSICRFTFAFYIFGSCYDHIWLTPTCTVHDVCTACICKVTVRVLYFCRCRAMLSLPWMWGPVVPVPCMSEYNVPCELWYVTAQASRGQIPKGFYVYMCGQVSAGPALFPWYEWEVVWTSSHHWWVADCSFTSVNRTNSCTLIG